MQFKKEFMGKQIINNHIFRYYVISQFSVYGVGIEENYEKEIRCNYIYFTEDKQLAYKITKQMSEGRVTRVSVAELIDDLIA